MFQRNTLVVLGLVAFAALGCSKETTSSANIKTGGFATLIDVYADNDATSRVHVELKVGGSSSNTYIALENGDKLTATAGDAKKTLTASDTGIYEVSFDGVAEDTMFTVALERSDETATSTGTLPAPFALDKPASKLSRKTDDLEVDWAPADTGDGVKLDVSGDCIFEYSQAISDTGSHMIVKNTLESTGGDMPTTCDLMLGLDRKRSGVADSDFDPESYMLLHQRRWVSFTSLP
jgi:hypothetical protein